MITVEHGDEAHAPEPDDDAVAFEVTLLGGGRAAMLCVRASGTPRAAAEELERAALDALLGAGVVHGLDRGHVAEAVAACDGAPRAVARATLPTAPVDGVLELTFAEALRHDPLHTVAAGTLLARRTPARPGEPGVAVTGEPLAPAEARAPGLRAGAGAEEAEVAGGVTVVRALIDGRPTIDGDRVGVEGVIHLPVLEPRTGPLRVFGSLEVRADLPEGVSITATGDLRVVGDVSRARIQTGGDIVVSGSCLHSEIRAGALGEIHRTLVDLLGHADVDLASACSIADQLVASAAAAGRRLAAREALRVVLSSRYPALERSVAEAARAVREPGTEVGDRVADAVCAAAAALEALGRDERVTGEAIVATAQALGRALGLMRAGCGRTSGVEAAYMQACRVEVRGSLVLTGPGTYNVDASVGEDLRALGAGATVRGGALHVGGRLLATELGAPGGAPVRVVLEGAGAGERLRAGVAHPGVEVVCGNRRMRIEAAALNLSVRIDEENRVVSSEDPLG